METIKSLANLKQYVTASVPILDPFTGYTYRLSGKPIGKKLTNSGDSIPIFKGIKIPPLFIKNVEKKHVAVEAVAYKNSFEAKRIKSLEVSHENILNLHSDFINSEKLYVAEYELMEKSLRGLLNEYYENGIGESMVAIVLKEVLKAVDYLHEEEGQYVYSISPDTVYIEFQKPSIKIGFASSIYFHSTKPHFKVHKNHLSPAQICEWGCAPEIVEDLKEYTTKAEIWLIGILGVDLLLGGIRVQKREDLLDLLERVLAPKIPVSAKGGRRQNRQGMGVFSFSETCKDFLRLCLKRSPYQRPCAHDMLKHEFINSCGDVMDFKHNVQAAKKQQKG